MKDRFRVRPTSHIDRNKYDVLIASAGFEMRSSGIPRMIHGNTSVVAAATFENNRVLSFEQNVSWFKSIGAVVADVPDSQFVDWIRETIERCEVPGGRPKRVAVDISSLSRTRIALAVEALSSMNRLDVDFLYMVADYSPPPE